MNTNILLTSISHLCAHITVGKTNNVGWWGKKREGKTRAGERNEQFGMYQGTKMPDIKRNMKGKIRAIRCFWCVWREPEGRCSTTTEGPNREEKLLFTNTTSTSFLKVPSQDPKTQLSVVDWNERPVLLPCTYMFSIKNPTASSDEKAEHGGGLYLSSLLCSIGLASEISKLLLKADLLQ